MYGRAESDVPVTFVWQAAEAALLAVVTVVMDTCALSSAAAGGGAEWWYIILSITAVDVEARIQCGQAHWPADADIGSVLDVTWPSSNWTYT